MDVERKTYNGPTDVAVEEAVIYTDGVLTDQDVRFVRDEYKAGGGAFVFRSKSTSQWHGLTWCLQERSTVEVELSAIYRAIDYAASDFIGVQTNETFGRLVVVSDCVAALAYIQAVLSSFGHYRGTRVEHIVELTEWFESCGKEVVFEWVPRSSCQGNRIADSLATHARNKAGEGCDSCTWTYANGQLLPHQS